ncbi:MAG TPA: tetratricopeptide repeat protein, partial [Kofleriaceae bacterium]|nr:tetratricopeptide repeat protein [Kofleriaceae bacterium]
AAGAPAAGSAATSAARKPDTKPPALTAAQRKEYRKHLAQGRKLGGAKAWGDAVAELQQCLKVIPGDARANGELGWAAFQAGDYDTARKANTAAVQAAGDNKVKASSLYNLGRVAEATNDKEAAARFYTQSLLLRPNKTVSDRLTALGKAPPAAGASPAAELPCQKPAADTGALCACLAGQKYDFMDDDAQPTCSLDDGPHPADLAIAQVDIDFGNAELFLLWHGPSGWVVLDDLGYLYKGGMMGVTGEMELGPITDEQVGGHRVVTVTMTEHHHDTDLGIDEEEELDTTTETVCVLGAAPHCPLAVPVHVTYTRDRLGMMDDSEIDAEAKAMMTPGLPIHEETTVDVTIGDDGVAKVVLGKGSSTDDVKALLGPHALW